MKKILDWRFVVLMSRNKLECALMGVLLFLLLAPGCDRLEEAHGFVRSGGYTIGNGVLVGCRVEGKPRVALLTCRHVVTARMLETGKAFAEVSQEDNYIYLNKRGWGFGYAALNNIDPTRWLTVKDLKYDFAWIILNESEISRVAGSADALSFVNIAEDGQDRSGGFVCERRFGEIVNDENTGPFVYSLFSQVLGPANEPTKQFYFPCILRLPWVKMAWGIVTRQRAKMTSSDRIIPWPKIPTDLCGRKYETSIPAYGMKWSSHVNKSGSPVFVQVGENGEKGLALSGIVTISDNKEFTGFQSLDAVLPDIRESLAGGKSVRVIDLIQTIPWRR